MYASANDCWEVGVGCSAYAFLVVFSPLTRHLGYQSGERGAAFCGMPLVSIIAASSAKIYIIITVCL